MPSPSSPATARVAGWMRRLRSDSDLQLVLLITLAGAALRFATLDVQSFDHDEAVTAGHVLHRIAERDAQHDSRQRAHAAALLRPGLGMDAHLRDRRGRLADPFDALRNRDDSRRCARRAAVRSRTGCRDRGRARRVQPLPRLLQPGRARLRVARPARVAVRGRVHPLLARADPAKPRGLGPDRDTRDRHPLLRRVPRRHRGDAAARASYPLSGARRHRDRRDRLDSARDPGPAPVRPPQHGGAESGVHDQGPRDGAGPIRARGATRGPRHLWTDAAARPCLSGRARDPRRGAHGPSARPGADSRWLSLPAPAFHRSSSRSPERRSSLPAT